MLRIASLTAALLVLGTVAAGPAGAPAAVPGACGPAAADYSLAGAAPATFQGHLDATYYEVGVGGSTYGPGPGRPVPWAGVAAWVRAHPVQGLLACGTEQGWSLAELRVRGGYAYVMLSPAGSVAKLYLSTTPLGWD